MKLRGQIEELALPATIAAVLARDVIVGIPGNRTRIKTKRGRIVLKARKRIFDSEIRHCVGILSGLI
jgi:hypothetical protein